MLTISYDSERKLVDYDEASRNQSLSCEDGCSGWIKVGSHSARHPELDEANLGGQRGVGDHPSGTTYLFKDKRRNPMQTASY